jgi:hypothetical protein
MSRGRSALVLGALLVWFCCRSETMRATMRQIRSVADFRAHAGEIFWPPQHALEAYVSIDDDTRLYYAFSRVVLGEEADRQTLRQFWHVEPSPELFAPKRFRIPFLDVHLGFPPLALVMMLAPRLLTASLGGYRVVFALFACLLYLALWALGARWCRSSGGLDRGEVLARAALVTACLGPVFVGRFDTLPALMAMGALTALAERRSALAGSLIVAGALAKLYPILLVPSWAAIAWARREKRTLAGLLLPLAAVGAIALGLVALHGDRAALVENVQLFRQRPVQIESLPGTLLLAFGSPVVFGSGSDNIATPLALTLAQLFDLALIAIVIVLALLAARWTRRHPELTDEQRALALGRFALATILGVLVTSKVLSPQYLVWLLPLGALQRGRRLLLWLCAALAATQLYFPFLHDLLIARVAPVVAIVLLRNALLVVLFVQSLRAALAPPEEPT